MPAGDLITQDYQFEIRTTLLGYGTDYEMERPGPQGLGNRVKDQDVDLAHDDGSYAGTDRLDSKLLTIPVEIAGTASATGAAFKTLNDTIWAHSTTDLQLHMQLPGIGKFYVYGRPRGLLEDMTNADFGIIRCQLFFKVNDPTIAYSTSRNVTTKALTANVATLTTSTAHGFVAGRSVTVSGVDATFDGSYTIASTPTSTTFTYARTAADVLSQAATGTATSFV